MPLIHFNYGYIVKTKTELILEFLLLFSHNTKKWCIFRKEGRKEGSVLFNDVLNTFYLRLYGVGHMVKIAREETCCCNMGYSFRIAATWNSHGTLAGARNSSMGPP